MALFGNKVSEFMGNIKIDREISDLESKKQALTKSVQNEISALNSQTMRIFTEIGEQAYITSQSGEFSAEQFAGKFSEITSIKNTISEKEAKIDEITARYDEEITLLKNLGAAATESAPAEPTESSPPAVAGNCSVCGAQYNQWSQFCKQCGNKLA